MRRVNVSGIFEILAQKNGALYVIANIIKLAFNNLFDHIVDHFAGKVLFSLINFNNRY